jgi:hypothetical protein
VRQCLSTAAHPVVVNLKLIHHSSKTESSAGSGYHNYFVFERSRVQISTRRPACLTEIFRGFSKSIQANIGMMYEKGYDRFLPHPFQFIIHGHSSVIPNTNYAVKENAVE